MEHDFRFKPKGSPEVRYYYEIVTEILNQVHEELRRKGKYTFQHQFVGSYSLNMITHDVKSNIGFDFDINIYPHDNDNFFPLKTSSLFSRTR